MLGAIAICERLTGNPMQWQYGEKKRNGDHIWWSATPGHFKSTIRTGSRNTALNGFSPKPMTDPGPGFAFRDASVKPGRPVPPDRNENGA